MVTQRVLVAMLVTLVFSFAAAGQEVKIDTPQDVEVLFAAGKKSQSGKLLSFGAKEIQFKPNGYSKPYTHPISKFSWIRTKTDTYYYNPHKGYFESARALENAAIAKAAATEAVDKAKAIVRDNQPALFFLTNGKSAAGQLLRATPDKVVFNLKGAMFTYPPSDFRAIQLEDVLLTFNQKTGAFSRTESVQLTNKTDHDVTVQLKSVSTPQGNVVTLVDDRKKSNLELGLTALGEALGSKQSSGSIDPKDLEWTIKPQQTVRLAYGGNPIRANQLKLGLKNSSGTTVLDKQNTFSEDSFKIVFGSEDVHSPVLVTIGKFAVDQDVWYSEVTGRTPTTISTTYGKNSSFSVMQVGRDYTYTKENRAGAATATAVIENPTATKLDVTVRLEFHFSHLLLSNEAVTLQFPMESRSKQIISGSVDTRGLFQGVFGNRKVTGVTVLDITTTVQK